MNYSARELRNIATRILEMKLDDENIELEELIENANDAVRDLAVALEKLQAVNILKEGDIITNGNGNQYRVLGIKPSYTFLERVTGEVSKYVVAWLLKEYDGHYSWGQGHYFETHQYEDAKKFFETK